ncbi:MAG: hypothetical protein JXA33_05625 [Anaerolineae bacterium]|nr:hypothetical protein [Anaerolineae bacterium]
MMKPHWFWIGSIVFLLLAISLTNTSMLTSNDFFVTAKATFLDVQTYLSSAITNVFKIFPVLAEGNNSLNDSNHNGNAMTVLSSSTNSDGKPANPPIPAQGGTCIQGTVIDHYHQIVDENWEVKATHTDGEERTTKVNDGKIFFSGLKGGTWTIAIDVTNGFQDITPRSFTVSLSGEGGECAIVRYKCLRPACLDVIKLDANGQLGLPDKVGIAGWQMTATNGNITLQGETNGLGRYRFE